MAATVAATALSTVAAISVDEGAGLAGSWLQLAARVRTTAMPKARNVLIINSFLLIVPLRKTKANPTEPYCADQVWRCSILLYNRVAMADQVS
jgi:hypothetical protein